MEAKSENYTSEEINQVFLSDFRYEFNFMQNCFIVVYFNTVLRGLAKQQTVRPKTILQDERYP